VPEPDWKHALRAALDQDAWRVGGPYGDWDTDEALTTVMPHIEAAYQRGLMAGRSQAGYATTRRKRKEPPCAPSAENPSPASTTEEGEP